eukprot:CAMPEP_0170168610 /NCGR_PEP_ID=MMETSP0040_2-20121228/1577_1 /TAXON_ID=641309 /ORGANISM="Lotharella oceanica, Strain CCMP622" /LENGTH=378 /DNA_ID=CAMNT_0010406887 /DNA_START=169 /DNA_END=1305 /DNA_ORIENTATION=+
MASSDPQNLGFGTIPDVSSWTQDTSKMVTFRDSPSNFMCANVGSAPSSVLVELPQCSGIPSEPNNYRKRALYGASLPSSSNCMGLQHISRSLPRSFSSSLKGRLMKGDGLMLQSNPVSSGIPRPRKRQMPARQGHSLEYNQDAKKNEAETPPGVLKPRSQSATRAKGAKKTTKTSLSPSLMHRIERTSLTSPKLKPKQRNRVKSKGPRRVVVTAEVVAEEDLAESGLVINEADGTINGVPIKMGKPVLRSSFIVENFKTDTPKIGSKGESKRTTKNDPKRKRGARTVEVPQPRTPFKVHADHFFSPPPLGISKRYPAHQQMGSPWMAYNSTSTRQPIVVLRASPLEQELSRYHANPVAQGKKFNGHHAMNVKLASGYS